MAGNTTAWPGWPTLLFEHQGVVVATSERPYATDPLGSYHAGVAFTEGHGAVDLRTGPLTLPMSCQGEPADPLLTPLVQPSMVLDQARLEVEGTPLPAERAAWSQVKRLYR